MAWPGCPSQFPTGFANRSCYNRVYDTGSSCLDSIETKPYRRFAGDSAGAFDPGRNRILVVICNHDFAGIVSLNLFVLVPAPERFDLSPVSGIIKLLVHSKDNILCGSPHIGVG